MVKKKRKTRVTRQDIEEIKTAKKVKANKRKAKPGPWTEADTQVKVKAKLKLNSGIIGDYYGSYPKAKFHSLTEKGWYPILINITSKSIKKDIEKHGVDEYIAACERSLNSEENKKKYGTIIILEMSVNNSQHQDRNHRFLSCQAKTNKKSIKGFAAIREQKYQVL